MGLVFLADRSGDVANTEGKRNYCQSLGFESEYSTKRTELERSGNDEQLLVQSKD